MNDMEIKAWHQERLAENLIKAMAGRGISASYAPGAEEARALILKHTPLKAKVGLAGSQTLEQIGVYAYLRAHGDDYELIDPGGSPGLAPAENIALRKKMLTCDVLLTGCNAIDLEGRLYNLDGLGNRTAAMMFGPDKVVAAISLHKTVKDGPGARARIAAVAGPMNSRRLNRATPCAETGHCCDCRAPARICNYFTIIENSTIPGRLNVVLIGGAFGY